jgi:hypothetical protein
VDPMPITGNFEKVKFLYELNLVPSPVDPQPLGCSRTKASGSSPLTR